MDILRMDIAYDWLEEKMGKGVLETIKDGADITDAFVGDIARPVKVIVLEVEGPGGGNPFVELHFMDEDHSWEWYTENMSQGDAEIDIEEYELARDIAA
jgi:hypothetical protein